MEITHQKIAGGQRQKSRPTIAGNGLKHQKPPVNELGEPGLPEEVVITHSETEITTIKHPDWPLKSQPDNPRQFRQKNNTAVLWENEKMAGGHDCQGDATINGKTYFVRGWTAHKQNGEKYLRLYFTKSRPTHCRWDRNYAKASRAQHRAS